MPAVECDSCGRRYQVDANLVGKVVRCRRCGTAFTAKPYGMDPTKTSMASGQRGQLPADSAEAANLADLAGLANDTLPVNADSDALDELFEAAAATPKGKKEVAAPPRMYVNPLDIHAPEPAVLRPPMAASAPDMAAAPLAGPAVFGTGGPVLPYAGASRRRQEITGGLDNALGLLILLGLLMAGVTALYGGIHLSDQRSSQVKEAQKVGAPASVIQAIDEIPAWSLSLTAVGIDLAVIFIAAAPLYMLGMFLSSRIFSHTMPPAGYLRALAVLMAAGSLSPLLLWLLFNGEIILIGLLVLLLVAPMWLLTKYIFGFPWSSSIVGFLFALILMVPFRVITQKVVTDHVLMPMTAKARAGVEAAVREWRNPAPRVVRVDPPRPAEIPVYVPPPPPPGVNEFPVESLPTLAGTKIDDIVLDQLRHFTAIGPYMFRPPAGHTIRGRRDATPSDERWEVQTAGGGDINVGSGSSVPAQRVNVVVVPLAAAKFKTPEEMLATPPVRYRQGTVNGWPFVVTYDVRSLSRDRFSFVSYYHVFTARHVVTFEVIAADPFTQQIHRELNLSVHTLQLLDPVTQALGDVARGEPAEKAAAMRRLASQPADASRRDKVVAAILPALRDPDAALRAAAADAAGAWIAEPAKRLEAALPLLLDEDRNVRDAAIGVVADAGKGDPAAIKAVAGVFEKSPGAASRALKTMGQPAEVEVAELLRKHADSTGLAGNLFDVMDAIATTASTEDMRSLARSDKRPVAERARKILKKLDKSFDEVQEALLDLDQPTGPYVKPAVDLLVGTKPDGRPAKQRQAVVEALRRVAFEGADDAVSDRAADVLATWATPELVPKLAEVLAKDTTPRGPARRAIIVLAGLKDPRGVAPVRLWITRENDLVVESLKQMGPVAEEEMVKMLRDPRPSNRRDACVVLGVIGSEKAIPQIQSLINDSKNPEVPAAAKAALDAIRARKPK